MEHTSPLDVAGAHSDLFKRHAVPSDREECWEWTGPHDRYGYARSSADTLTTGHRVGYLLFRGPINAGLVLDHLCRNRWCVNPWHLEPVTNAENTRRQRLSGICRNGLHAMDEANLIWSNNGKWRKCRACSNASMREATARYRAKKKALAQSSQP